MLGRSAPAQNLDLGELAAALAFPIVTGGQAGNPIEQSVGDIVYLFDINPNISLGAGVGGLGSMSGHLELVPQPIAARGPVAG